MARVQLGHSVVHEDVGARFSLQAPSKELTVLEAKLLSALLRDRFRLELYLDQRAQDVEYDQKHYEVSQIGAN